MYSELERSAIDYATRHGVVVGLGTAGNCAAICPESYANYPAALPHVIGRGRDQSARPRRLKLLESRRGSPRSRGSRYGHRLDTPTFVHPTRPARSRARLSARSLPRIGIRRGCPSRPLPFQPPRRWLSVARPLSLRPGQLRTILARAARDIGELGHDSRRSGYGLLDVDETFAGSGLPSPRDRLEPESDDTRSRAATLRGTHRVLRPGERDHEDVPRTSPASSSTASGRFHPAKPRRASADLALWRPHTEKLDAHPFRLASRPRRGFALGTPSPQRPRAWVVSVRSGGRGGAKT